MDAYQQELISLFEKHCKGKTVIELGAHNGYITEPLSSAEPAHLTAVEPNLKMFGILEMRKNHFDHCAVDDNVIPIRIDNIINSTANDFYSKMQLADVVVCFGVLYHLHSPLHLLELIVNKSKPLTVILEPMHAWPGDDITQGPTGETTNVITSISQGSWYGYEVFGEPGSAQSDSDINNPLKIALHADASLFIEAMKLLGYSYNPVITTNSKSGRLSDPSIIGVFTLTKY